MNTRTITEGIALSCFERSGLGGAALCLTFLRRHRIKNISESQRDGIKTRM
jgi:hypothetical protein